jgi:hypothetical protein
MDLVDFLEKIINNNHPFTLFCGVLAVFLWFKLSILLDKAYFKRIGKPRKEEINTIFKYNGKEKLILLGIILLVLAIFILGVKVNEI